MLFVLRQAFLILPIHTLFSHTHTVFSFLLQGCTQNINFSANNADCFKLPYGFLACRASNITPFFY